MKKNRRKTSTATVALWVMALSGWGIVICVSSVIGLKALWNQLSLALDPPPEDGKQIVAKLEQYRETHYQYPRTQEEAGIPDQLPGPVEVRYIPCGSCCEEYELIFRIGLDDDWVYGSWNRNWTHYRLPSGG